MSTFRCEVVHLSGLEPHPNADTLSIVRVFDYPVIVKTQDWDGLQTGVYIPVDSLVPDTPQFAFLEGQRRIKAKRLRGIFSQGMLVPTPEGATVGDDVASLLGIVKYEPPEPIQNGDAIAPPPGPSQTYTEIEHLRRYSSLFEPGEQVVATEKIHGMNARYLVRDGVLYAGSHKQWKARNPESAVWKVVTPEFESFMRALPDGYCLFGEVFGWVQSLRYGHGPGKVSFRAFDILDTASGQYLDWSDFFETLAPWGHVVRAVPVCYRGPWDPQIIQYEAEKDSRLATGQIAEGVVVKPTKERWSEDVGRVVLKLHSQRYLLKNKDA